MVIYLFFAVLAFSFVASASFYFRMRKVGRLLGGRYRSRMDAALTLLVIIPVFLSLVPDIGSEGLLLVTTISGVLSFAAGALLLPGVLLDALGQQHDEDRNSASGEAEVAESFEEKVQAIRERQRAKRETGGDR